MVFYRLNGFSRAKKLKFLVDNSSQQGYLLFVFYTLLVWPQVVFLTLFDNWDFVEDLFNMYKKAFNLTTYKYQNYYLSEWFDE